MNHSRRGHPRDYVTQEDIKGIFGDLDTDKLLAIEQLRPTLGDLEQASMWLSGDHDIFGAEKPLTGIASDIVDILTADEEDFRD
jgi:hypothetical protein